MARPIKYRAAVLLLAAFGFAGCDKCGNRVKFDAPSLPNTCGAATESTK